MSFLQKRRFIKLTGKSAYDFLRSEAGRGKQFYKTSTKEENGEKILCIKDDSGIQEIMLSFDAQDGTEDGKIGDTETLAVLPNGSIVNTMKYKISILDKIANRFGGGVFSGTQSENSWDWEHFWGSFDGGNFADNFFSNDK